MANETRNGGREMTKVLLVDDDPNICQTLVEMFKRKGYFVAAVGTAKEALDQVKKIPFHFAVIDIRLPDMSGIDLLQQIWTINYKINCIMITGYPEESPAVSREKGAVDHLMKPLKVEQLIEIFNRKPA